MKLRVLAATLAALGLVAAPVLAQNAPAPAQQQPAPPPVNKPVLSYAIGYDLGRDLAEQNVDVDINAVIRAVQDGFAKKDPAYPKAQMDAQLAGLQQRMIAEARAEIERVARENKAKSDAFLASTRSKPNVVALPSGVLYRVIDPGSGAKPTNDSTVQIHYRGSVSTGQEFANTYAQQNPAPVSFKVSEFPIAGVREALLMMPQGARWEVFLPPEKAFGNDPRSPVGPGQALVFDITLVSVR
ncbi:FKBP-type peptidyl-prolyl cis-trans isomerase N-terminal domain-containing protein [Arenimonas fontis]|uniref:Peptidyl-prolyl cis-trans isomerase n=1 Tax=Arenimonas fontis TaxID=2608255 RepID=A0A5B2ZDK9_9GAMM|nr:FKBP-type peptidyl-prolyl cis-trans isomerase N-terminal domain-containing protein [Arenimonas fontis]KAA2285713.1 FKBP-type peptidyl-prolyl cis-trans isomerase [Arenimonas fontis]